MIRVLRVLEYTYATGEQFAEDRQKWTPSFDNARNGVTMQSSVVSITAVEDQFTAADDEPIDLVPA